MGVALGPVLGGLLIHSTGNLLTVFYFACALHGISSIIVLFILPESLTPARARGARLRRSQEKVNQVSSDRVPGVLKSGAKFFSPLAVFLPKQSSDAHPYMRKRYWSLLFIAIAYGLNTSIIVSTALTYFDTINLIVTNVGFLFL